MCGRFTLTNQADQIQQLFGIPLAQVLTPNYNITPSSDILCLMRHDEQIHFDNLYWGLIPSWAKDNKKAMINVRAESLLTKPMFKKLIQTRRCCIIASGFYEWQQTASVKQPYYIQPVTQPAFAMAGIWSRWHADDGKVVQSCAIITTAANASMLPIHPRMPLILRPDQVNDWLAPAQLSAQRLEHYTTQAIDLQSYPVSTYVNNPRHNSAQCIAAQSEPS